MLQRLDELDQECSLLKEEVIEVKNSREVHVEELQDIHICYQQVQQQLSERQVSISTLCTDALTHILAHTHACTHNSGARKVCHYLAR